MDAGGTEVPTAVKGRADGAVPDPETLGGGVVDRGAAAFYEVLSRRRDVRSQFTGEPVDEAVVYRLLAAAHCAPSVGLSQPWDFIVVVDDATRRAFWEHVQSEREVFAGLLDGELAERFARIKVDGVLESSLSVVVTYDPGRGAPRVLGRHAIAVAGLYSVCLAIENLWLASTVVGWGMGWVSFYREEVLSEMLGIPEPIRPVAWLCLGPVSHLETVPDLERAGWRTRTPLGDVLHHGRWQSRVAVPVGSSKDSQVGGVAAVSTDGLEWPGTPTRRGGRVEAAKEGSKR
jgi:5,6-dimethylbenzimidazole synthase